MKDFKINDKDRLTAEEALAEIEKLEKANLPLQNASISIPKDPNVKPVENPEIKIDTDFALSVLKQMDELNASELTVKFEGIKKWNNCNVHVTFLKG